MKTAHDIILKPVITENSMAGIADKKYTFKVATDATKVEIAQAVETLFPGAKVAKVNTISVRGRFRRQGMHAGYTAASKKAIVTLTKDSKEIEFFNSILNEAERAQIDAMIQHLETVRAQDDKDEIKNSISALSEGTKDFAARRMNRTILEALQGKSVDEV